MKLCVLVARGLGAAHIGPYGNRWVDTTALDALASQGVVFDVHLAAHPDPDSARRVMRTGRHVFPQQTDTPPPECHDLLDVLRGAGVRTWLVIDSSRPYPATFEAGWDVVHRADGLRATIEQGRQLLGELAAREGPGLLWLDLASLLPPWNVSAELVDAYFAPPPPPDEEDEEDGEPAEEEEEEPLEPIFDPPIGAIDPEDDDLYLAIRTTYAAAISELDALLPDLLEGLPDDVAVLFTSDHGQALGEHGVVGAVRPYLHAEVVDVPLILHLAGRTCRRRVEELTLSVDLAPTMADLFGVSLPGAHGRSLLPLVGLERVPWREHGGGGLRVGDAVEWALWTRDLVLRLPVAGEEAAPRLYVKPDDRWEVNDVVQHHLEEAEAMEHALRAYVAACARPGPLEITAKPQAAEADHG
jgi:arylsulfatase A-like enzyme